MSVPLDLFGFDIRKEALRKKIWYPFKDHVDEVYRQMVEQNPNLEKEHSDYHGLLLQQTLAQWNATTDWEDDTSPLYFDDEESLVQFVLTWGS